mmetsp:Transcript_26657/g.67800  ORF Transcript_26657/g.67800 Transcript_26657/m.67800 type:complete len:159 (+) Transcript_26657:202-678(+)
MTTNAEKLGSSHNMPSCAYLQSEHVHTNRGNGSTRRLQHDVPNARRPDLVAFESLLPSLNHSPAMPVCAPAKTAVAAHPPRHGMPNRRPSLLRKMQPKRLLTTVPPSSASSNVDSQFAIRGMRLIAASAGLTVVSSLKQLRGHCSSDHYAMGRASWPS